MDSKSNNIEILINDEADEVIKELFDSLKNRYQNNLESVKAREFVFNYVHLLCYKCPKINPNHGGSYIDSLDWIKNKKAAIHPINTRDNKCFQNVVSVVLNNEDIGKQAGTITKINPFMNKYKWEWINFPAEKDDWKKIEKYNVTIALNVLHVKKEKIYPAYVSKNNSNRENQVIIVMIQNREGCKGKSEGWWHYLSVKRLSAI